MVNGELVKAATKAAIETTTKAATKAGMEAGGGDRRRLGWLIGKSCSVQRYLVTTGSFKASPW